MVQASRQFEPIRWAFVPEAVVNHSQHAWGGSGMSKLFALSHLRGYMMSAFKPQVQEKFLTWSMWLRGSYSQLSDELAAVMAIGKAHEQNHKPQP
eukprot:3355798-Prymnesium_polylepis.1